MTDKLSFTIVTGLSGAGRSVAINALQDIGCHSIDNIPVALLPSVVEFALKDPCSNEHYALGMNIKDDAEAKQLIQLKESLSKAHRVTLIFLEADEDVIATRYSSTRRRHPLIDTSGELLHAIREETRILERLRPHVDVTLDTSTWSPHQLMREIESLFSDSEQVRKLHVTITSFGFKYGLLKPVDNVYDVRFLKNPYFNPKLKNLGGIHKPVQDYIFSDPKSHEFFDHLLSINKFLIPQYYKEGKHYLRIGIGCTGGMHRSVCMAEKLARSLAESELENVLISVDHRDLQT